MDRDARQVYLAASHHHALDHLAQGEVSAPAPAPLMVSRGSDHRPPPHLTERLTEMHRLALPAAVTAALVAGLTLGTLAPAPAAPAPITTPAQSQAWRCHDGGPNKICDTVTKDLEDTAWRVWAAQAGAKHIRVDGSRPFKVEVIGYASVTPRLTPDQLALTDGGVAYVYGVHYLD